MLLIVFKQNPHLQHLPKHPSLTSHPQTAGINEKPLPARSVCREQGDGKLGRSEMGTRVD
ncbi:MAG: hypothetical protein K8R34_14805 [Methanosarcinales archaeon]|nr:hypothetical protein [Methanosarcinales archaeon]